MELGDECKAYLQGGYEPPHRIIEIPAHLAEEGCGLCSFLMDEAPLRFREPIDDSRSRYRTIKLEAFSFGLHRVDISVACGNAI